ncbi:hypothetical protein EDB95_1143 [Dinghuibacter silviterrae]|uniref:Uncharacterized protein n=1 Tax=Dinghuibacter silviterrae TaxID=1539049 RepID=A0A4R8DQQ0_9BACT|nr:hypothetical protein EDB95_1143 [Dinghuibacter silviterrae]
MSARPVSTGRLYFAPGRAIEFSAPRRKIQAFLCVATEGASPPRYSPFRGCAPGTPFGAPPRTPRRGVAERRRVPGRPELGDCAPGASVCSRPAAALGAAGQIVSEGGLMFRKDKLNVSLRWITIACERRRLSLRSSFDPSLIPYKRLYRTETAKASLLSEGQLFAMTEGSVNENLKFA